jgi:hypothetical protein
LNGASFGALVRAPATRTDNATNKASCLNESTPMLTSPFLTDLDSRAAVKGSRDPLGIQQIWTRLGRYVVGNLTTVSDSVRDFTTLLLGYYFAARLVVCSLVNFRRVLSSATFRLTVTCFPANQHRRLIARPRITPIKEGQ